MWFLGLVILSVIGFGIWLYQRKSPVERDQQVLSDALWVDQVDAELALAKSLFEGKNPDYERAYTLLQNLSQQHELPEAYMYMAFMQQQGLGRPVDISAAKALLETAHQRGSDEASYYLGQICQAEQDNAKALYWYQYGVARGNPNAQYQLAKFYLHGIEVEQDIEKAQHIWMDAAKKGQVEAQYRLAEYLWQGQYFAKDQVRAKQYLHQAVQQQHPHAIALLKQIQETQGFNTDHSIDLQYLKQQAFAGDQAAQYHYCLAVLKQLLDTEKTEAVIELLKQDSQQQKAYALSLLGSAYYHGWGVSANTRQAFQYWTRAAAKNEPIALCSLGFLQQQGILLEQPNFVQALALYQQAAQTGEVAALCLYAECYLKAVGTAANPLQAQQLLSTVAKNFSVEVNTAADALYVLALFYAQPLHVFTDQDKANHYLQQAADMGSSHAMLDIAHAYLNGQSGFDIDLAQARAYFEFAMQHGHITAQTQYALLLLDGHGGAQDQAQAFEYLKAAAQQDSLALTHLARCYEQGLGVVVDLSRALSLYQQAIALGEPEAYFHMGRLYAQGHGVVRNIDQALEWLEQAQHLGHVQAAKLADSLQQEYE